MRSVVLQVVEPVREFFELRSAEQVVRGYSPAQLASVRLHFEAAESRYFAGRRLGPGLPAAVLLRQAVALYVLAAAYGRDGGVDPSGVDIGAELPAVPPDPTRPEPEGADARRLRAAFASDDDGLYLDRLPAGEIDRLRGALERAAVILRRRVEARSLAKVQRTRWARLIVGGALFAFVLYQATRAALAPVNVAKGKPVTYSSLEPALADAQGLTDGEVGTSFGVHTRNEESPHVDIDLIDQYRVETVKVHNRADGWFDDCLPLVVELSVDGKVYNEIGKREEHFDAEPPWIVDGHSEPARYVRLLLPRKGYIALSEVEVFGKKIHR
jgi:hypothetical protein